MATHSQNLRYAPVQAHWEAAAVMGSLGGLMALARGAVVAMMEPGPPAKRLLTFAIATRAIAPLYIIPFVLGSQLDCYQAIASLRSAEYRPPAMSHDAAHLG